MTPEEPMSMTKERLKEIEFILKRCEREVEWEASVYSELTTEIRSLQAKVERMKREALVCHCEECEYNRMLSKLEENL